LPTPTPTKELPCPTVTLPTPVPTLQPTLPPGGPVDRDSRRHEGRCRLEAPVAGSVLIHGAGISAIAVLNPERPGRAA
jgi:hypothetical protein